MRIGSIASAPRPSACRPTFAKARLGSGVCWRPPASCCHGVRSNVQFFVVDLEFSGFIPGHHEILEIGAVALDASYTVRDEWETRLAAEHPDRASDWVKLHQARLLEGGVPAAEAIPAFVRW